MKTGRLILFNFIDLSNIGDVFYSCSESDGKASHLLAYVSK